MLRFFAYRHADHMTIASGRFLDAYMFRSKRFDKDTLKHLAKLFRDTFALAAEIYSDKVFREYNPEKKAWGKVPRRAIADAELVAISDHLDAREILVKKREDVVKETEKLFKKNPLSLLRGHGSADAVRLRINLFRQLFKRLSKED